MISRLSIISREMSFASAVCADRMSAFKLILHTIFHHAHNHRLLPDLGGLAFTINVRLGSVGPHRMRLRTFRGDLFVFYEVLMRRVYALPRSLVDPSKVRIVIDAGGNVGLSALFFAMAYENAKILTIEASAENFRVLAENVSGIDRIEPIHAALTGQPLETVCFSSDQKAWGNRVIPAHEGGVAVPAVTLEGLCRSADFESVDLLKVDIEGGEADVFAHGAFLPRVRFGVVELHFPYSLEAFKRDLQAFDYEVIDPNEVRGLAILAFRPSITGKDAAKSETGTVSAGDDTAVDQISL